MKLVIQNTAHVWGGNEKWLSILATGLQARGHDVIVSCAAGPVREKLHALGIATSRVRPRGDLDVFSALSFAFWLKHQKPDAVLITSNRPTLFAAWAAHVAKVPRTVVRMGIVREPPPRGPRAYAFAHWIDDIIANSTEISDAWNAPGARVHVVMNAIEERSAEHAQLREKLRNELQLPAGTLIIGGAGHLAHRKGFDLLLEAFARAQIPSSVLVIVGDGPEREALGRLAASLQLNGRVRFLGSREDGPDVVAGMDIFALCSRNEGMANVMLEAMAAGVPVVATAISGVRQALAEEPPHPAAGRIVPLDDTGALAAALREFATEIRETPQLVESMVAEARRRIQERFSKNRMIDECEAILFGRG
jgi:glycosyltransferase involved in cell wall biosynthesis